MTTESQGLSTGVVLGRFQAPFLHAGHRHLLNHANAMNPLLLIILGVSTNDGDESGRNPYTSEQRVQMLERAYPNAMFAYIEDNPSDEDWSDNLDVILAEFERPTLYGSRDSFISHYSGNAHYEQVFEVKDFSATKVREYMNKDVIEEVLKVSNSAPARHIGNVMLQLVEEVGELSTEVNIASGFKKRKAGADGVTGEAIDIIQCALDVIYLHNPDITKEEIKFLMMNKLDKWKKIIE